MRDAAALLRFLAAQRESVLAVLDGLSDSHARTSVVPSGWTPRDMTVHLAGVERHSFAFALGEPPTAIPGRARADVVRTLSSRRRPPGAPR
ncbi:DUF664 domain-containing protein [Pseudonocardia sp. GCM10023141]|uniref:mycothiol transferase n=1 Tax=Pseudonocardia sp. GCM10023141 TaxID=3252653 RepID=UPI00360F4BA6